MPSKNKPSSTSSLSSFFANLKASILFYCTYVYWFIMHCAHPPVDTWRVLRSGFDWETSLHQLYVDAKNQGRFDPEIDFATVVGCSTGVGFEVAAGLASTGLTVLAGIRRGSNNDQQKNSSSNNRVQRVVEELKQRSREIFTKHHIDKGSLSQAESVVFDPKIIGIEVDVSDLESCQNYAKEVARILGKSNSKTTTSAEASSPSSSPSSGRRSSSKNGRKSTTATTSSSMKKLRVCLLNAAILMTPYQVSPQGFEAQAATNALGHMVLAEHLIDRGCFVCDDDDSDKNNNLNSHRPARDSRLIFVSSSGARFGEPLRGTFSNAENSDGNNSSGSASASLRLTQHSHCQFKMYGDSKALILCYAKLLQRKILSNHIKNNNNIDENFSIRVLHPGCIASQIVKDSGMPGRHGLAWAQKVIGIPIMAMIHEENASVYPLRLCLGVAGTSKKEQSLEERELFSYIFNFETKMMAHLTENEKTLENVRSAVVQCLNAYMPKKKSLIQ